MAVSQYHWKFLVTITKMFTICHRYHYHFTRFFHSVWWLGIIFYYCTETSKWSILHNTEYLLYLLISKAHQGQHANVQCKITYLAYKMSRCQFWIFKLFQSLIVLGKNEYLYRSILDCRYENFKELVRICDTSVGWGEQRLGNTSKFLTILKQI